MAHAFFAFLPPLAISRRPRDTSPMKNDRSGTRMIETCAPALRAIDWQTWLVGAAIFAASTALVVLVALLLVGGRYTF